MATVHRWKCDICGKEFGENDAGFKTRSSLSIDIFLTFGVTDRYNFGDSCLNCRTELSLAVADKLEELKTR